MRNRLSALTVLAFALVACSGESTVTAPAGSPAAFPFDIRWLEAPDTAQVGERTDGFTVELVRVSDGDTVPVEDALLRFSSERGCATPFGSFLQTTEEGRAFPEFTPQEAGGCFVSAEYIRQRGPAGAKARSVSFEAVE